MKSRTLANLQNAVERAPVVGNMGGGVVDGASACMTSLQVARLAIILTMEERNDSQEPRTGVEGSRAHVDVWWHNREVEWSLVRYKAYLTSMLRDRAISREQHGLAMQDAAEYFATLLIEPEDYSGQPV